MGVVQEITHSTYRDPSSGKATRFYPIDKYSIPPEIKRAALEYHILKVPLLGQYTGTAPDWCGRTSSSMAYNYYQLIKGGSQKANYITQWRGTHPGAIFDLRLPNGQRAYHQLPDDAPYDRPLDGAKTAPSYKASEDLSLGMTPAPPNAPVNVGYLLSDDTKHPSLLGKDQRDERARQIAKDPDLVERQFKPVLDALRNNNPVLIYTGVAPEGFHHIILFVGYAYFPEPTGGKSLWIAIADPATEILHTDRFNVDTRFIEPGKAAAGEFQVSPDINSIPLVKGDWTTTRGTLGLVRASHLFEWNKAEGGLLLDYGAVGQGGIDKNSVGRLGGEYHYKTAPTEAPPEVVESSLAAPVQLPFDRPGSPFSPIPYLFDTETTAGGFYLLGSHQNVHTGVHLSGSETAATVQDDNQRTLRAVRAPLGGSIAAIRLRNALPSPPPDNAADAASAGQDAQKACGNEEGFILLRHRILATPKGSTGKPKTFTFYSLLMHFAPPVWRTPAEPYADVRWADTLGRCHGAVVVFDPAPARRFLVQDYASGPIQQPGVSLPLAVYDDQGLRSTQPFEVDTPTGVVAAAVVRDPSPALQKAYKALTDQHGHVATFDESFLPVKPGELIGYVADASSSHAVNASDGEGFLHWEVLSPVGAGGLKDLLDYGVGQLGLPSDLFKLFDEKTAGNHLDQSDFDTMAKLLPAAEQNVVGDARPLHYASSPEDVAAFMQNPALLAFAQGASPTDSVAMLSYVLSVQLNANKQEALPAGSYSLSVAFDVASPKDQTLPYSGSDAALDVVVPGNAHQMLLTPSGFHLRDDGVPSDEKQDLALFTAFAKARWRNVRLDHPNEWTKDGLKATMSERVDNGTHELPGDPGVLAEILAWWNNREQAATDKNLFGGELPADTKLENAHPVLVTWLLRLLCAKKLVVVDTYAQGTSKDAAAMAYLAWVPALAQPTPRLVGEAVTAVGIAKGDAGVDVPVTLKLSPTGGGDPLVLSSTSHYGCGVVSLPLPLPVWGKWTLAADGESPQEIGSLGVEGKKPEIRYDGAGGIDSPVKVPKTEGLFTWTVDFKQNCPVRMSGCVMLQSWKDSEEQPSPDDTMPEDFAVPIEIVASASPEGVQIKDGFVVNADPKLHLTSSFTYGDYSSGGAPISCGLIQTVQAIRDAYKKATGRGVTLTGLTPDGLTVTLKGNPDKLAKAATGSKAHVVQAPNGITITMQPPDGTASGRITFQFDPSAAIGALLRAKGLAPGEQLNVRFGLLFPNGGFFADESLQVRSLTYSGAELNAGLFEKVNFAKLRADPSNCIEAWPRYSGPSVTTALPAFGPPVLSQAGDALVVTVPLLGGRDKMEKGVSTFWREAKPTIVAGDSGDGAPASSGGRWTLSRKIPMVTGKKAKTAPLQVHATAKSPGYFDGASVQIPDSPQIACPAPSLDVSWTDDPTNAAARVVLTVTLKAGFGRKLVVTTGGGTTVKVVFSKASGPTDDPLTEVFTGRVKTQVLLSAMKDTGQCDVTVSLLIVKGDVAQVQPAARTTITFPAADGDSDQGGSP